MRRLRPFADGAGYAILRLLEKPSKGHVKAPSLEGYEQELKDLESHFRSISSYRGGMAGISPDRPWGQAPAVGSVIMQGMIDKLPAKMDAMAETWACITVETGENKT